MYPIYLSIKKNENQMELILIENESNSHYNYIKDFNRLRITKQSIKTEGIFV